MSEGLIKSIRFAGKQFVPYGLMCVWLKRHYGVEQDKPLFYYPGVAKRLRRIVKFSLPYGLVKKVKQPGPAEVRETPAHPMLRAPTSVENLRLLKPRVLIIAELSIPQCTYYRVQQKEWMLRQAGVDAVVDSWTDYYSCLGRLQTATLVIFYRVPYTPNVAKLYAEARRLGLRVGFDIDDLVFDLAEYSKNSSVQRLPEQERKNLLDGALLYQKALAAADFSIASTAKLQSNMRKYCTGPSYIIPNGICRGTEDAECFPLGRDGRIVIGYGSGTTTHNQDFVLCADAVLRILREFPNVVFVLHGMLELPDSFADVADRIVRVDFVPFGEYAKAISRFDINLIPLESGVFNDCKSNIKYLEASLMGVPSVASPCAEFRAVIKSGENGFIASNRDDWYQSLRQLVSSEKLRKRIGANARKTALARYDSPVIRTRNLLPLLSAVQPKRRRRRKRILVVNVLYPPTSFGGATVLCENLVAEYRKTMDVCVFTMSMDVHNYPGHITRYDNRGEMCYQIEMYPPQDPAQNWDIPSVLPAFQTVVGAFEPDTVHFHSIQFLGVQLVEFCRDQKLPYFITAHDAWWICERQFMLDGNGCFCAQDERGIDLYQCAACTKSRALFTRWKRMRKALNGALMVLTPSDYQTALYKKSMSLSVPVLTNHNGIPIPDDIPPHRVHTPLTFAYIGGKCQHKGYYFLQRVVAKLHGEYKLKLIDLDLKFGHKSINADEWPCPEKIEIYPPFDHHGLNEFYKGIDVLLFPSCCKESFGLTIREALARNIWVVSTKAGGDIEFDLHDRINGSLIDMFDVEAYAAAMQRMIDGLEQFDGFINPHREQLQTPVLQAEGVLSLLDQKGVFNEDLIRRKTDGK